DSRNLCRRQLLFAQRSSRPLRAGPKRQSRKRRSVVAKRRAPNIPQSRSRQVLPHRRGKRGGGVATVLSNSKTGFIEMKAFAAYGVSSAASKSVGLTILSMGKRR